MRLRFAALVTLAALGSAFGQNEPKKLSAAEAEFFETKIRPVLARNCYGCHAGARVSGGLAIDSRDSLRSGGNSGAAVVPGDPGHSLLLKAVKYEGRKMPPGGKLPDAVIADLEKWIEMGAPDPRTGPVLPEWKLDLTKARSEWPYTLPVAAKPPAVKNAKTNPTSIDRFIQAKLEARNLTPAPAADKATLLRRLTLDLTGLLPTAAELDAFEKDRSPRATEIVVDRLLGSPRFGERWGRHWLDVARYADSIGRARNYPFALAWRYRDWVIDAVNADLPYDQFVMAQIAGDQLPHTSEKQRQQNLIATGFLALGAHELNEGDQEQYRMDVVDDMVNATSKSFLGLTVGCARCHNHKFDPVPQTDYYAVAGIFRSTDLYTGLSPRARDGRSYYKPAQFLKLDDTAGGLAPEVIEKYQALTKQHEEATAAFVAAQRQRRTNEQAAKVQQARREVYAVQEQIGRLPLADNLAMGVKDALRIVDSKVALAGDVHKLGPAVPRGLVQVLSQPGARVTMPKQQSGRLELARWIAAKENPLTARVMANRVWSHLFGRGIVGTVDNFGKMGDKPTHPELLDYLAVRFMDQGWSTKKLIREIVLSKAYQRSSAHVEKTFLADPMNELFWRQNRQRLEVEAMRDALLQISGRLQVNPPPGSPTLQIPRGTPIQTNARARRGKAGDPAEQMPYRSIYVPVLRSALPPMYETFDFPEPSETHGTREVTTVSTQALFLLNNPFVLQQADLAADRLLGAPQTTNAARIRQAYREVLARNPDAKESALALKFVDQTQSGEAAKDATREAWSRLYQALFASAEFRYRI